MSVNHFELVGGALAYAATVYSLSLVSWAVTRSALPVGTHVGLRLAAVLVGQFVGCAVVVQSLGLIGQFRAVPYLAVTLAAGAAVSWFLRKDRLHHSLWRLVRDTGHLWLNKTPLGLGYVSAAGFLFLAVRTFAYVNGIDSLTIHGPLVARWVQLGRVELTTHLNYPQCWEYQYAPHFLLLHSDILVIIPSLLPVGVLLLLVREVASHSGIPGKIASLVSLLTVLNPVVWRGTMKNDLAVAIGLLLCLLALERVARGRRGAALLSQLGTFMLLGSKASGFLYAGLLLALFIAIWLIRRWRQPGLGWDLARLLAGTAMLQISAAAVQIYNLIERGNPTYPIKLTVGGRVLFEGPGDLSGTSILAAGHEISTWVHLFRGSMYQLGLDFPFLAICLLAGSLYGIALIARNIARGRRPDRRLYTFCALAASTQLLWILYLATPLSRGIHAKTSQYIIQGDSLRYAIGPICLSYVVATAFLMRQFGRQRVFNFFSSTFLALIFAKWFVRSFSQDPILLMVWKLLILLAVLGGAMWTAATLWRMSNRLPPVARHVGRGLAIAGLAVLLLVSYGQRIEEERAWRWEPSHRKFWRYVRLNVPDGATIGTNKVATPLYAYFLLGARLENRIQHMPFPGERVVGPDDPDYYYLVGWGPSPKRERRLKILEEQGWEPLRGSANTRGILLRRPRLRAAERIDRPDERSF